MIGFTGHGGYERLVKHVYENGERRTDRTGTGTYSVFGTHLEYDLMNGFPLITSKKTHFKSVLEELLWFLRGETNISTLNASIWDEWADEDGELGPIYGHQWTRWGSKPDKVIQRVPHLPDGVEATYLGVANGAGKEGSPLKNTWKGMISRCYNRSDIGWDSYGGRGVSVIDRWLEFKNFEHDATGLPGYEEGVKKYLDKDILGSGFLYGPDTCSWVSNSENQLAKSTKRYTVEDQDGKLYTFTNPSVFCREQGIPDGNFSDLWTGRKNAKVRNGFRLVDVSGTNDGVNQIQQLIDGIRETPESRRLIVSAWNPPEIPEMALAPCHVMFQVYLRDYQYLDLQVYQRSADLLLGVPFNIASYALLVHILASITGYIPGKLTWIGGDTHLYINHLEQAEELIYQRSIPEFPLLTINRLIYSVDSIDPSIFELTDYNPNPVIKAPVAV